MRPEISATLQGDLLIIVGAIAVLLVLGFIATRVLRAWHAVRGR
jgi:hypothetical protein